MSFTQPVFAWFLLITLSIFYAVRSASHRRMVLLLSSCLFYGWFDMRFLALFFFTAGIDFYCGQLIYLSKTQARRKLYLLVSLVSNFGVLGFFKYYGFFRENAVRMLELLGVESQIPLLAIILPIGLSFYTFQSLSYTIDIYFGKRTPVKSALDFSAYSHIAIGAGQLFGFQLPENFRSPYHAEDPQEFWRRWHISFSRWIRDYLYIPLGGNRGSNVVQVRNLVFFFVSEWNIGYQAFIYFQF